MLLAALLFAVAAVQQPVPRIDANPNVVPAGRIVGGELRVQLEVRLGRWFPEGDRDPSQIVQAFAEAGRPLQIPGPLIRVRQGTRISATIRNPLSSALIGSSIATFPCTRRISCRSAWCPIRRIRGRAKRRSMRCTAFIYHSHSNEGHQINSGLYGALVVVEPNQPFDSTMNRVFVIGGSGPQGLGRVRGR